MVGVVAVATTRWIGSEGGCFVMMQADASTAPLFGPVRHGDDITFQLWAPDAGKVSLRLHDQAPRPLAQMEDGFWRVTCPAVNGTPYRFDVDGTQVPDPASRFQPDDVHGASQVCTGTEYVWQHATWVGRPWEETVLYELHVGICRGYGGVRKMLPALAKLGITAIELMPIADFSGLRNWGYDGVLPFAPDHAYGTPDQLRALVDDAHGLGLMVFLDVVYNHFGPDGNWLPAYAPAFFDEATQTPWGAAIDFHKPQVRRFFTENALYWLESFRFDGLRLDAVHAIQDRSWLLDMAGEVRRRLSPRHVHLVLENENNDAGLLQAGFDAQWNDDFHNVMHVVLTGESHAYYEDFAQTPAVKLARCLEEGFIYQGEASLHRPGATRGQPSAHLAPTHFVAFLQNHDQIGNRALGERLTTLVAPEILRAAMVLLLLCPQVPMLFMGEEVGAREPFLFFTDFHGELGDAVREGRRREFAHSPGFDGEGDVSRIPDPNARHSFDMSIWTEQAPDASEWRGLIKRLLALRHEKIVTRLAGSRAARAEVAGTAAVVARWTLGDGARLTIAANFATTQVTAQMPQTIPLYGKAPNGDILPGATTLVWLDDAA